MVERGLWSLATFGIAHGTLRKDVYRSDFYWAHWYFILLRAMLSGTKVELEALYTLGIDALTGRFLETAIIREDYI